MAIVEQVIIKVDIDADITGDLASIEARIKALEKRFNDLDKAGGKAGDSVDDLTDRSRRLNKEKGKLEKRLKSVTRLLGTFGKGLKKLSSLVFSFIKTISKISFLALAAEIAIFSAALLGVKAALVGGRALVKGYQYAMTGLAVAAASVATGLAVAAAAMRQYQEAQLIPLMGGGVRGRLGASRINRGYTAQTRGLYGSEAMGAVTASLAAAGVRMANPVASQLYNISGGDAKAAQALAAQFASAKQSGSTDDLITALKQTRGFNAESIQDGASLESIISTISSGAGTADAYQNVAEDMAGTFIGSIKTEFESIKTMFADAGVGLLGPFQDAFMQIARIVKDDLLGIFQVVREFGSGSLAPSLVSFANAVSEFVRSKIVDNVSNIAGTADKLRDFFGRMGDWYERTKDWFKSYEKAANVVWDMVKAIFTSSEGGLFRNFSDMLVENRDAFVEFGSKIGEVITAIKKTFMSGNSGFFGTLDRLNETLTVVAESVIPAIADVMDHIAPLFEKLPEILKMIADRFGPVLVNILKALKPIFDKIPDVVDGILTIVEILEPFVTTFLKVVSGIMTALSKMPGGNVAMGAGALAIGGGALALGSEMGRDVAGKVIVKGGKQAFKYFAKNPGSLAKVGKYGGLTAGALVGTGVAAKGVYDTYNEGATTGNIVQGVGGATLAGASIGTMIAPGVGTAIGAAVGLFVGGVATGIAAWRRDSRIEKASAELASDFMNGVESVFKGGAVANGFTDDEFTTVQNLYDLGKKAESASVYYGDPDRAAHFKALENTLNTPGGVDAQSLRDYIVANDLASYRMVQSKSEDELAEFIRSNANDMIIDGDNDAMKEFIQLGLDSGFLAQYDEKYANMTLEDFDLDEFAKEIDEVNAAFEKFIEDETLRRDKLDVAIENVADSLNLSADVIKEFMDEMGITIDHAENLNELALKNLYALYNSPVIDLAQGFSADLASTTRNREEVLTSADAAYNTLIQEAGSEEGLSTATMQDYLSKYSSAAVALGGNAATAELGAISNLQRGIRMGEVSPDILEGFDLDQLSEGILRDMAEEYAVSFEELSAAFNAPGGGVGGVERFLKQQSEDREAARDIFFGSGDVLEGRSNAEINELLSNPVFARVANEAVNRLGDDAAEEFAATGGSSEARLEFLESEGLLRGIIRTLGAEGESVFGVNLADMNDPVAQQMAAVASAIETQEPPQMNLTINGEAQDRAGGQVALVSVSWSGSQYSSGRRPGGRTANYDEAGQLID